MGQAVQLHNMLLLSVWLTQTYQAVHSSWDYAYLKHQSTTMGQLIQQPTS